MWIFRLLKSDSYQPPLQDTSLDNTTKTTLLSSMTLPNGSKPHSFTEEQSSFRNLQFHDSHSSDKENDLIKLRAQRTLFITHSHHLFYFLVRTNVIYLCNITVSDIKKFTLLSQNDCKTISIVHNYESFLNIMY